MSFSVSTDNKLLVGNRQENSIKFSVDPFFSDPAFEFTFLAEGNRIVGLVINRLFNWKPSHIIRLYRKDVVSKFLYKLAKRVKYTQKETWLSVLRLYNKQWIRQDCHVGGHRVWLRREDRILLRDSSCPRRVGLDVVGWIGKHRTAFQIEDWKGYLYCAEAGEWGEKMNATFIARCFWLFALPWLPSMPIWC